MPRQRERSRPEEPRDRLAYDFAARILDGTVLHLAVVLDQLLQLARAKVDHLFPPSAIRVQVEPILELRSRECLSRGRHFSSGSLSACSEGRGRWQRAIVVRGQQRRQDPIMDWDLAESGRMLLAEVENGDLLQVRRRYGQTGRDLELLSDQDLPRAHS